MARDLRTEELREQLHVQVSAAAVVNDGGEAFKKLDAKLAGADAGVPECVNEMRPAQRQLTPEQVAEIAASFAAMQGGQGG